MSTILDEIKNNSHFVVNYCGDYRNDECLFKVYLYDLQKSKLKNITKPLSSCMWSGLHNGMMVLQKYQFNGRVFVRDGEGSICDVNNYIKSSLEMFMGEKSNFTFYSTNKNKIAHLTDDFTVIPIHYLDDEKALRDFLTLHPEYVNSRVERSLYTPLHVLGGISYYDYYRDNKLSILRKAEILLESNADLTVVNEFGHNPITHIDFLRARAGSNFNPEIPEKLKLLMISHAEEKVLNKAIKNNNKELKRVKI